MIRMTLWNQQAEEHAKRKSNQYIHGSKNVYIRPLDKLPNKTNLGKMFSNKSNKMRLQDFLKTEFQRLSTSFPDKQFIYSVQRECEDLKTGMRLSLYECNHQEADTIIFFITHFASKWVYQCSCN